MFSVLSILSIPAKPKLTQRELSAQQLQHTDGTHAFCEFCNWKNCAAFSTYPAVFGIMIAR
jgi:hypothetical protein